MKPHSAAAASMPAGFESAWLRRAASQPARNIATIPEMTPQIPNPIPSPCHWPRSLGSNAEKPIPAPSDRNNIQTPKPKKNPAKSAPQLTRFKSGSLTATVAIVPSLGARVPEASDPARDHVWRVNPGARTLAWTQWLYWAAAGAWPLVHKPSFEAVT